MVENTGNFCLPHLKLRYPEGVYAARQYYPRLICCRHTHSSHQPIQSPGQGTAYSSQSTSPAGSPTHSATKSLCAHIEGTSVVSKIAHPPTSPQSCCPTPGVGGLVGGGAPGGRGGVQVVVHQPTHTAPTGPWMFMPGGCACRHGTPNSTSNAYNNNTITYNNPTFSTTTITTNTSGNSNNSCLTTTTVAPPHRTVVAEHSLTPGSGSLDKYLETFSDAEHSSSAGNPTPAMKNGQQEVQGEVRCYTDRPSTTADTTITTTTTRALTNIPSTSPPIDGYIPVSKLSDASDFSDDYTQMTDVTVTSDMPLTSGDVLEDTGVSVCSDVFSDEGIILDADCGDLAAIGSVGVPDDIICGDMLRSQDDFENDIVDAFANIQIESPTRKTLEHASEHRCHGGSDLDLDLESPTEPLCVLPYGSRGRDISPSEEHEQQNSPNSERCNGHPTTLQVDKTDQEKVELPNVDLRDDAPVSGFYEDREFDFLNAPRIKRSTSLKTYKTPPGTPKRKMVRFADALGLDLESVRHILNQDGPPRIPMSATRDLNLPWDDHDSIVDHVKIPATLGARYLTACFQQPGINPTFPIMVGQCKVLLESCVIHDYDLSVSGTIRVANIHYHKDVTVRYTTNNWLTHNDISAGYVHNSNDGPTDRFSFTISLPTYFSTGSRLQFCIRYITGGQEFWDSNQGGNYRIECYARVLPESDNCWTSFL